MGALDRHQLVIRSSNEDLARRANVEDGYAGGFLEGRLQPRALFDEAGLHAAMAYVDLNLVRVGIAVPEEFEFTSIHARIQVLQVTPWSAAAASVFVSADKLLRFRDEAPNDAPAIPFTLKAYLELVDWSGRIARSDKRGAIDNRAPPILTRLGTDPGVWQNAMALRGDVFGHAPGRLDHLRLHTAALGQQRIKGLMQAQRLYRAAV